MPTHYPTCAVSCTYYDDTGAPVVGAIITAKLDRIDTYYGYVIPETVEAITDIYGRAVLNLWPNELGSSASSYTVKSRFPNGKTLSVSAVVPNVVTTELHLISSLPAYPAVSIGQQILTDAVSAGSVAIANAQSAANSAVAAHTSEINAASSAASASSAISGMASYAASASTSATVATSASQTASTQADVATTKATQAAASADQAAASALAAGSSSIRYDVAQSLTSAYKAQARSNLGLSPVASSGSYADLTDKPLTPGSAFRNLIINGAMAIDQRNSGAAISNDTSGTQYSLDRWAVYGTVAGKFAVQQNAGLVTPPSGFTNYLGVTAASTYSLAANDTFYIAQSIEGLNSAQLSWGSANAKAVVLSFQVYTNLVGAYGGTITNANGTRSYPFTFSVALANAWTPISISIPGDQAGTWLTTINTGVKIILSLGAGITYIGTPGAWTAGAKHSGNVSSVVGTAGQTFYVTACQFESGTAATSFENRPYAFELALCKRYFESGNYSMLAMVTNNGYSYVADMPFSTPKRVTPTMNLISVNLYFIFSNSGASYPIARANMGYANMYCPDLTCGRIAFSQGGTGQTTGANGSVNSVEPLIASFSAEL